MLFASLSLIWIYFTIILNHNLWPFPTPVNVSLSGFATLSQLTTILFSMKNEISSFVRFVLFLLTAFPFIFEN